MATTRPFARNTGGTIFGTTQYGNIVTGDIDVDYSTNYGDVKWWMGPDEELGYVVAFEVPSGNHPNPVSSNEAYIGFYRAGCTEQSFLDLLAVLPFSSGLNFSTGDEAKAWLINNGYWTSWGVTTPCVGPPNLSYNLLQENNFNLLQENNDYMLLESYVAPTPTPTPTSTPTPTPTATSTPTPIPATATPTPTPTQGLTGGTFAYILVGTDPNDYHPANEGYVILPNFDINGALVNPNLLGEGDGVREAIYFSYKDSDGNDNTSYYGQFTGGTPYQLTLTQNGDSAIYTGTSLNYMNMPPFGGNFFYQNPLISGFTPIVLIQSSNSDFVAGDLVYITITTLVAGPTPTPTPTSTPTPTPI